MKHSGMDDLKKHGEEKERIDRVTKLLKEIHAIIAQNQAVPEECLENFKQTSAIMSSLLPKASESDSSLFEVDDLMYPNENINALQTFREYPKKLMNYFIKECYETFLTIYHKVNQRRCYLILDRVFLQLIEHSPDDLFLEKTVFDCITNFIGSRVRVCQAMKFLKSALFYKCNSLHKIQCHKLFTLTWLEKLKNIPEPRHPDKKRLASWLRHQSTCIIDKLEQSDIYMKTRETVKRLHETYFDNFHIVGLITSFDPYIPIDILSTYFSSAKNEVEQQERATCFVNKHQMFASLSSMSAYFRLCDIFLDSYECSNDLMKIIDGRHCNDLEPYTWSCGNYFVNAKATHDKLIYPTICGDEPDYTIEKYLVYDEFLKGLYVMSMIRNALVANEELLRGRSLYKLVDRKIHNDVISQFLKGRINNHELRRSLPWWFPTLLKMCPFLILSKYHENMIEPLVRMLKGEENDEVTLEKLYYVIK